MAQFAGSRSEFMTSDLGLNDIEYQRKGGCFLTHKKSALIIALVLIAVILAGFTGAYLGSLPKDEELSQPEEYGGVEGETKAKFSVTPSINPSQYTVELTPIIEGNKITKLKGRVIIHFNNNATDPLHELVFNAKNITLNNYQLLSLEAPKTEPTKHTRRRREDTAEDANATIANATTAANETDAIDIPKIVDSPGSVENGTDDASSGNSTEIAPEETTMEVVNATSTELPDINATSEAPGNLTSNEEVFPGNDTTEVTERPMTTTTVPKLPEVIIQKVPHQTVSDDVPVAVTFPPLQEVPTGAREILVKRSDTDETNGIHAIYLEAPIGRGAYSLEIEYETPVDGHAAFTNSFNDDGRNRWVLATKLKPIYARQLFPGFDNVKLKARFSLSVARPKNMTVLSNMPLKSQNNTSNGWVMDNFDETPLLSPHNLAFIETDLQPVGETLIRTSNKLKLWGKSGKKDETSYIIEKAGRVLEHFVDFFSTDYPMPKLDIVALPGMITAGSGSTGLISIKESLFYITEKTSLVTTEQALMNIIQLIGEQWLGGLVNMKNWTDAWVIEGSLIYLQHLFADKIDSTFDYSNSFVATVHQRTLEAQGGAFVRSLSSRINPAYLDPLETLATYDKGACLIRMLHSVISDDEFRSGYQRFVSGWANKNADVESFWNNMSDGGSVLPGSTMNEVMKPWVDQKGIPVVTVTRNYATASATIRQEEFSYGKTWRTNEQLWYIPLTFVGDGDNWSLPKKQWMGKNRETELNPIGKAGEKTWMVFNVNKTGCYRVNYDEENWILLTTALNSSHESFPVATRTSLVDDAFSVARAGLADYRIPFNLIRYIRDKERHGAPWIVMLHHMTKLYNLLYNTMTCSNFQEFLTKFVSPLYKEVGSKVEEGSQLTLTAIEWSCLADHQECLDLATKTFSKLEKSPKDENPIPPYLRDALYCAVAKYGAKKEWDFLFNKTITTTDKEEKYRLLSSLSCFRLPWIVQTLLNAAFREDRFEMEEIPVLLRGFAKNPVASEVAYRFLRQELNGISPRYSNSYHIMKGLVTASAGGILDTERLKDLQRFRRKEHEKLRIVRHTLSAAIAEAEASISWLQSSLPDVRKWLMDYNASTA